MWIRRVVVPGLTDVEDDLRATGEFVRSLGGVEKFEMLPYHTMGAGKWKALGLDYALDATPPPGEDILARARMIAGIG